MKTENLSATAFAPANISLIFETYPAEPPHGRGSLGVGITLDEGVQATVRQPDTEHPPGIFVTGERWEFPTVQLVLDALKAVPLHIELVAAFPFGCGFGMSGASALSTAYAVNEFLQLGQTREQLGMIAHHAEVQASTGLGDVGGQFNGGVMIKTVKNEPLTVTQLPLRERPEFLYVRIFGPIHTADVINSEKKVALINKAAKIAMVKIARVRTSLTMNLLLCYSCGFAVKSKLMRGGEPLTLICQIQAAGGMATMIMLGEAIVSDTPFEGSRQVRVLYPTP